MARKVLISFLGTGNPNANRRYDLVNYEFDDGTVINSPLIAHALEEYYNVELTILIGTTKSMWEEVYGDERDGDFYCHLMEVCKNASNATSEVDFRNDADRIEKELSGKLKIHLIKYGINHDEIITNIKEIMNLDNDLCDGDELIVDITHSFRSLPLILMNSIIYLRLFSQKHISISNIVYGMKENNEARIVELNDVLYLNEWLTAAYSFKSYGRAEQVAELLKDENNKAAASLIKDFSNVINLSYLSGFAPISKRLKSLNNSDWSPMAQLVIPQVIDDFTRSFPSGMPLYKQQYNVAKWQYEKGNYGLSYMSLTEAIVSLVAEISYKERDQTKSKEEFVSDFDVRDKMKSEYLIKNCANLNKHKEERNFYLSINKIRNTIAHSSMQAGMNTTSLIKSLKEKIDEFNRLIDTNKRAKLID